MKIDSLVGVRCMKHQGLRKEPKPFKSGLKFNTIRGAQTNPHTGLPGFTFNEDVSVVNQESIVIEFKCLECETLSFHKFNLIPSDCFACEKCKRKTVHKVAKPV